eukprot:TRINITY_DN29033_c0_g1_i1.p1 TRINITY_DN29033_c0_g1~~TRINITY_DN29033_c0_g1_i1.p1  ORF type:complete len:163 (-),score=16.02 TRINITY_DN29033_c0_g1_i1:142-630(-)
MASKLFLAVVLASLCTYVAAQKCTGSPTTKCDFYVDGSPNSIPTVTVEAISGNRILSSQPVAHKSGQGVVTAYSYSCTFLNEKKPSGACGSTFFFMNKNNHWNKTSLLASHMIPKELIKSFKNKCVLLTIDNVQLKQAGWVNNGDGKKAFPQSRRCVIFNTA